MVKLFDRNKKKNESSLIPGKENPQELNERKLRLHIADLERQLESYRENDTLTEDRDIHRKRQEMNSKIGLIQELTNAKEALRRLKRKRVTGQEKKDIFQKFFMFKSDVSGDYFLKADMVIINGRKMSREEAKEEL